MAAAQQNQQSLLMLVMIILLGLALGYFYYSSYIIIDPVPPPPISEADDLKAFEGLQIDFDILSNKKYQALQIFGEAPVNPGATGKKDIFSPI
jgi:hypothetical protein